MTTLTATRNPVFVDAIAGETSQRAEIQYDKLQSEELWEMTGTIGWSEVNVLKETGRMEALTKGARASGSLTPGMSYQICVCEAGHGPTSSEFKPLVALTIFCLLKKPKELPVIGEVRKPDFGGTWCRYIIPTNAPTYILDVGVSRSPISLDGEGLPKLDPERTDGSPTRPPNGPFLAPPVPNILHTINIAPLLPGNDYFFTVLVADTSGNWETKQGKASPYAFTTFRRQLTVQFPTIHIFNDGDWATTGEGRFLFGVNEAKNNSEEFNWSEYELDDWGETDRPYKLGFAHLGKPRKVDAQLHQSSLQSMDVGVYSRGTEEDTFSDDETSGLLGRATLPLPVGVGESVSNQAFQLDCEGKSHGDDFHYGVDVVWSVTYVP